VQVALHQRGLYHSTVDGLDGPATRRAVLRLQQRKHLIPDGVVGRGTLAALGGHALPGARILSYGARGLDVAALQFALAWHGFPSGQFDVDFGPRVWAALRGFQRWSRLPVDGVAGPQTIAALRRTLPASPVRLAYPVFGLLSDGFGPRGARFHAGVDLATTAGTPVAAAAAGVVTWAGWRGGWGKLVVLGHGGGIRTLYAHLSRMSVRVGQHVGAGASVGLVGSTGHATGPHLHFEVRVRGAAVDPLTALRYGLR